MNSETDDDWTRRLERPAFGALVAFLLAPVIAHGLWRPLVHFIGPSGRDGAVTGAALAISGTIVVVQNLCPGHINDLLHVSAHEKESGFDRAKRGKDFLNGIDIRTVIGSIPDLHG